MGFNELKKLIGKWEEVAGRRCYNWEVNFYLAIGVPHRNMLKIKPEACKTKAPPMSSKHLLAANGYVAGTHNNYQNSQE